MSAKNADKVREGKENRLQGNWGEHFIASELASQDCFVRNVTEGHDTGIDLYCETTSKGDPFLHFWCQIRTTRELKVSEICQTRSFKRKHKNYWLSHPVPVFIFFVPVSEQKEKETEKEKKRKHDPMTPYYIFSAIDFNGKRGCTIKSKYKIVHDESETNKDEGIMTLKDFIKNRLPFETFLWDLKNGKVSYLKESPDSSYVIKFPPGYSQKYEKELSKRLRWTLRILSDDILFEKDKAIDKNSAEIRKRHKKGKVYAELLEILAEKKHDKHYETYKTIGHYYEVAGDDSRAEKYCKKSIEQIVKDKKLNNDDLKRFIKEHNIDIGNDKKIDKLNNDDLRELIKASLTKTCEDRKMSGKIPNGPRSSNVVSYTLAT
ncbi:MAG: DUF4365 domain-containing protein [Deltaproteobacteria bacterium]|nr:DUF4365 domain-containing protein [Deltaproteobacteria bacterium]